jgi:hypothetical protein
MGAVGFALLVVSFCLFHLMEVDGRPLYSWQSNLVCGMAVLGMAMLAGSVFVLMARWMP